MTDHLPECPHANSRTATFYGGYCVCPLLRACEQRVLDALREAVATQRYIPLQDKRVFIITRNAKLWQQRDSWTEFGWWGFRDSALAAIDALREGRE